MRASCRRCGWRHMLSRSCLHRRLVFSWCCLPGGCGGCRQDDVTADLQVSVVQLCWLPLCPENCGVGWTCAGCMTWHMGTVLFVCCRVRLWRRGFLACADLTRCLCMLMLLLFKGSMGDTLWVPELPYETWHKVIMLCVTVTCPSMHSWLTAQGSLL